MQIVSVFYLFILSGIKENKGLSSKLDLVDVLKIWWPRGGKYNEKSKNKAKIIMKH